MQLLGIDLAWKCEKNSSALAVGELQDKTLLITAIESSLVGVGALLARIDELGPFRGIAIDASLIINNRSGMRECEKELNRDYAGRAAGCHPTNRKLYPHADSCRVAEQLLERGYQHLPAARRSQRWQMECYPHPALIEIFNLPRRLLYKKGRVEQKKSGQIELAKKITNLHKSKRLRLRVVDELKQVLNSREIEKKRGAELKANEDALDSIICCYSAALYASGFQDKIYGDISGGYIYVPQLR